MTHSVLVTSKPGAWRVVNTHPSPVKIVHPCGTYLAISCALRYQSRVLPGISPPCLSRKPSVSAADDSSHSFPCIPFGPLHLPLPHLRNRIENREQELHLYLRLPPERDQHHVEDVRGPTRRIHDADWMSSCHQAAAGLLQAEWRG